MSTFTVPASVVAERYAGMQEGTTITIVSEFGSWDEVLTLRFGSLRWIDAHGGSTGTRRWLEDALARDSRGARYVIRQGESYGMSIAESEAASDLANARLAAADRERTMARYGRLPWWA